MGLDGGVSHPHRVRGHVAGRSPGRAARGERDDGHPRRVSRVGGEARRLPRPGLPGQGLWRRRPVRANRRSPPNVPEVRGIHGEEPGG